MEELIGTIAGGAVWGMGFALGLGALKAAGDGLRPVVRTAMKGAVGVTSWVGETTSETRETLKDLYNEAKVERETETADEPTA